MRKTPFMRLLGTAINKAGAVYDIYISAGGAEGKRVFNLIPHGQNRPPAGYYSLDYLKRLKGF